MTKTNPTSPKKHTTAWHYVHLASVCICIFFGAIATCVIFVWSVPLGVAMFCTGIGFLLINSGLSSNIKNLLGLLLAAVGYLTCLPGTFQPVSEVIIRPYAAGLGGKHVTVTVDANHCIYDLKTSSLTCDAQVRQAGE